MTIQPKGRLVWRREPNETGLARVCQSPRGAELRLCVPGRKPERVGWVNPVRHSFHDYRGWYWIAWSKDGRVPRYNTVDSECGVVKTFDTLDAAKADCFAYVKSCLAKAGDSK